jgi:uncharacterized protein YdaU (DUF1376 family)
MKAPSFQFYAQDFLTGVIYLTNEEVGIYIKMLSKQWTDGKIPKKRLGFLVGYDWVNLSDELKEKFTDVGDYVFNERLEVEREKKTAFIQKQSENGKKGGRPLKKEKPNKPKPLVRVNPNENQIKPLEEEDEIEDEIEIEVWPTFEDFWSAYDKKIDRERSESIWGKIKQPDKTIIIDAVSEYVLSTPNKEFRKNPVTYLRNESWKNEIIVNNTKNGKANRLTEEQQQYLAARTDI